MDGRLLFSLIASFVLVKTDTNPNCNLFFPAANGSFSSPNYPENYAADLDCHWFILVSTNDPMVTTVRLQFHAFHTDVDDKLRVYDGPNATFPIILEHSGTTIPNPIDSRSNVLLVTFSSAKNERFRGFNASYHTVLSYGCGGNFTGVLNGVIASPGYPSEYIANDRCTWNIQLNSPKRMNVSFTDMYWPSVTVTDSGFPLYIRNGTESLLHVITSTKIQVETNGRGGRWRAEFQEIETTLSGCGGTLDESTRQFTSLGYPFGYPAGSFSCSWFIQVEAGYIIVMNFTDFDTDSYRFTIRENRFSWPTESNTLSTRGNPMFPFLVYSRSNSIAISFDVTGSSPRFKGWKASYSTRPTGSICNLGVDMEAGIFNSPDYPVHTGSSLNCGWTFRVRPGYGILFNFTEFDTSIGKYESMISQFADRITFYEENSPGTSYLMDVAGLNGKPFHLTTRTSVVTVRFASDEYIARRWKATFHEYEGDSFGCMGTLNETSQTLTSPGYPHSYLKPMRCIWQIKVDPGFTIELMFNDFEVDPTDYIAVYDGDSYYSNLLLRHNGTSIPQPVQSTSNIIAVWFYNVFESLYNSQSRGWSATYRQVEGVA